MNSVGYRHIKDAHSGTNELRQVQIYGQIDRDMDNQIEIWIDRDKDRQRYGQIYRDMDRQIYIWIERQRYEWEGRDMDRQTRVLNELRQIDRDRNMDGQIESVIYTVIFR